jgi:hypothetical protein
MAPRVTCECGQCAKCKHRAASNAYYRRNAPVVRKRVKRHRELNIDDVRAYDRARGFRETDPVKIAARNATRSLGRGQHSCEECGAPKADAHHDDYSRPLDVRWLCETCHGAEHRTVAA